MEITQLKFFSLEQIWGLSLMSTIVHKNSKKSKTDKFLSIFYK